MYATAAARSDGLLLLCGGRDVQGTPLADAYGFARHRDGRWEWHAAPGSMPSGRYQHGAVFVGARLHISGGAVGGGRMVRGGALGRAWVAHAQLWEPKQRGTAWGSRPLQLRAVKSSRGAN
jgi:protein phosphatase